MVLISITGAMIQEGLKPLYVELPYCRIEAVLFNKL
jgi:hypothetical protein